MTNSVRIKNAQLLIDDVPLVVLCASLFPFRIPPDQWQSRLVAVKKLGYHAIDVYVPWNFHESRPGTFDFTGARDVGRFLDMAADNDLLVLARPGPYICSEYDGGALPAWLGTVTGLRVRQNEPIYLQHVRRWFDQILPILAARQVSRGGPVALLQLENELDFFDCDDPRGYIDALKNMADQHEITVPTLACAGQGDLQRATGDVVGVIPAPNLYPDDESTDIEATTRYYGRQLRDRGLPLLITETNRRHRTLKRMLASGAALLGPYLQASSWNFDFSSSTGNWGTPFGLMASDYDFGGAIAPNGHERPDAGQGRLLSHLIGALGGRLGAAEPAQGDPKAVALQRMSGDLITSSLNLFGGGTLTGLTNLTSSPEPLIIDSAIGEIRGEIRAGECLLLVTDLPLEPLGIAGTLMVSTAEMVDLQSTRGGAATLAVHTDRTAELVFDLPGGRVASTGDVMAEVVRDVAGLFHIRGSLAEVTLVDRLNHALTVRIVDTAVIAGSKAAETPVGAGSGELPLTHLGLNPEPFDYATAVGPAAIIDSEPMPMERHGIFQGGAHYISQLPGGPTLGMVLGGAGDIVSVHTSGTTPLIQVNGGTDRFIEFDAGVVIDPGADVTVRTEIWGHSNFDDRRLPSLRLGSLRGITSAMTVVDIVNLTGQWLALGPAIGRRPAPMVTWGGWSSSARPQTMTYRRTLRLPDHLDAAAVRITGTESVHQISVDGTDAGSISPLSPVLDISGFLPSAGGCTLEVSATRTFSENHGFIDLLIGRRLTAWRIAGYGLTELVTAAEQSRSAAIGDDLPLIIEPGRPRWLHLDLTAIVTASRTEDLLIRTDGHGLKLTFLAGGHIVGRVWAPAPEHTPITGGRGDIALMPAPWLIADPSISVLAEAVGPQPGVLRRFGLSHRID